MEQKKGKESTGQAIMAKGEYKELPIGLLASSPTNPRKIFDEKQLDDLAKSIREKGILEPLLVRKVTEKGAVPYEIIAGERRWRAAKKAGLQDIRCIVVEMTNQEVIEAQIIENMHRTDLTPLEEARGYKELHVKYGKDWPELSAQIGKSKSYIYGRLSLLSLPGKVQMAVEDGSLPLSWADEIMRVPDEKDRLEVFDRCKGASHPSIDNFTELKEEIESEYLLELKRAPFSTTDTTLAPATVGACIVCRNRTGSDPDLFGEFAKKDCCQNKACWNVKKNAELQKKINKFKAQGKELITGKAAEKILNSCDNYHSEYNKLDSTPSQLKGNTTWREALKGIEDVEILYVQNDSGEVESVVKPASVLRKVPAKFKNPNNSNGSRPKTAAEKLKEELEKMKKMAEQEAYPKIIKLIVEKAEVLNFNDPNFARILIDFFECNTSIPDPAACAMEFKPNVNYYTMAKTANIKLLKKMIALYLINAQGCSDFEIDTNFLKFLKLEKAHKDLVSEELKKIKAQKKAGPEFKAGVCRICGCTDSSPCETDDGEGCSWADNTETLCDAKKCVAEAAKQDKNAKKGGKK
jgi:ParB/RepB/Spo0J family partition protein